MKDTLRSAMLHVDRFKRGGKLRASALVRRVLDRAAVVDDALATTQRAEAPARDPALRAELAAHGGHSLAGSFDNAAGTRPYKLYISTGAARHRDGPPLVVMLHGCQQNPDDFAAGTRMNEHAESAAGWCSTPASRPRPTTRAAGPGTATATSAAVRASRR